MTIHTNALSSFVDQNMREMAVAHITIRNSTQSNARSYDNSESFQMIHFDADASSIAFLFVLMVNFAVHNRRTILLQIFWQLLFIDNRFADHA